MKAQFDHILSSSFYLWFDDKITREADAILDTGGQVFDAVVRGGSDESMDVPLNLDAYYCPDRQLVNNGISEPSGVYVDGVFFDQGAAPYELLIDHQEGRILTKSVSSGGPDLIDSTISGNFKRKELNVYITNETEEELLIQNDFVLGDIDGEPTYLQQQAELGDKKYTLPAAFISLNSSENEAWALGGVDDTRSVIRVVIITDSNYSLDATLSLFRDSARSCFALIDFENFPFGEFYHVKNFPYDYLDFSSKNKSDLGSAYIQKVVVSKLFDRSGTQIPQGLRVGFADFEVSSIRF